MSEERIMPKMLDYQKEIVKNTIATTIIGNMSRGGGKDYILACKILYERPKVCMYMNRSVAQFRTLQEKFEEIFNTYKDIYNDIVYKNMSKDKIKIKFKNEDVIEIYNYNALKRGDKLLESNLDMMLYSDCLPQFNIKARKHIAMVSISYTWLRNLYPCKSVEVYNIKLKQLIENHLMTKEWLDTIKQEDSKLAFRQEFDLFEEYNEVFTEGKIDAKNKNFDISNFYDKQIEELMIEYSETPKNKNTTLTRENILKQITILQNMKKK